MPPSPQPPALSDAELRETMNLLGAVVANMSERLDHQTRVTETLLKAAEATFTMAAAAKKQTDPARFAEELGNKIDAPIWKIIDAFTRLHNTQLQDARSAKKQADCVRTGAHPTGAPSLVQALRNVCFHRLLTAHPANDPARGQSASRPSADHKGASGVA